MPRPRTNLSGAFGIVPAPAPALLAHPERAMRVANLQRLLWAIRISAIAGLLALLYLAHVVKL
jgi:hypothetical protein